MSQRERGFTLIELLMVVAIISLLSSIVAASLSSARARAKDISEVKNTVEVYNAIGAYYLDNGVYPTSGMIEGCYPPFFNFPGAFCITWLPGEEAQSDFNIQRLATLLSPYISKLPDSLTGANGAQKTMYMLLFSGTYNLWASLRNQDVNYCHFPVPHSFMVFNRLSTAANNTIPNPEGSFSRNVFLFDGPILHGPGEMIVGGFTCLHS